MKRKIIKLLAKNRIGYAIKLFKENIFNMSKIDIYNIFHYKGFKEYYFNKFLLDYCENIFPNIITVSILEDINSPNNSYNYMIQNCYDIEYIKLSFNNDICVKTYGIFPITKFLSYLEKIDKTNSNYIRMIINFVKCNHINRAYCFEHKKELVMINNTNEHITEYFIDKKIISLMYHGHGLFSNGYNNGYKYGRMSFMSNFKVMMKSKNRIYRKLEIYMKHHKNIKKLDFYYGRYEISDLIEFIKKYGNKENMKLYLELQKKHNLENE